MFFLGGGGGGWSLLQDHYLVVIFVIYKCSLCIGIKKVPVILGEKMICKYKEESKEGNCLNS